MEITSSPNLYQGNMSRTEGLGRLERIVDRLGVRRAAVRVRPTGHAGMAISFPFGPATIFRQCDSQGSRDRNFICLVLWLGDLVRNVERGIESMAEATWNEGGQLLLAAGDHAPTIHSQSLYRGKRSIEESLEVLRHCLVRLGREEADVLLDWDVATGAAELRLRIPSGEIVQKRSTNQVDARSNVACLVLWLQSRCRNLERGIERDLRRLFASNLLPMKVAS